MSFVYLVFDSSVNKPGHSNSKSNIPSNQMEQNEKELSVSKLFSSSSELDDYPAMPKLSVAAEESGMK